MKRSNHKFNRKILIIVLLLLLIVVFFGVRAFIHYRAWKANNVYYNNYHFVRAGNLWHVSVPGAPPYNDWTFHFNPSQLEDVKQVGKLSYDFMNSSTVYITFDPYGNNLSYDAIAAADLSIGLFAHFGKNVLPACTRNATACQNVTIINCSSANKLKKAVVFLDQKYTKPEVIYDDYCVIVRGYSADLVRAQEYFLMNYYGIIPNKDNSGGVLGE